jgi:hypothetical protein
MITVFSKVKNPVSSMISLQQSEESSEWYDYSLPQSEESSEWYDYSLLQSEESSE